MYKLEKSALVWIVDDDEDDIFLTQETLSDLLGYVITKGFFSGENFIEYAMKLDKETCFFRPNLILLDLNMPGKSGLETLRDIKSISCLSDIPVIIQTHSSECNNFNLALKYGAFAVIRKCSELQLRIQIENAFPGFASTSAFPESLLMQQN